jgi:DNA-binding PucR family transcriptional regulator
LAGAPGRGDAGTVPRAYAASLNSLLVLSMLMFESAREDQIFHLAASALPSLAPGCELIGIRYLGDWRAGSPQLDKDRPLRVEMAREVDALPAAGGPLTVDGSAWAFAFTLRSPREALGFLAVQADREPTSEEQFLLRTLAQQTGVALVNARMAQRDRERATELSQVNEALATGLSDLRHTLQIHSRLNEVALSGRGQQALADAVQELTGFDVAVEDRYGNLRAWAPGDPPDPYPKPTPHARDRFMRALSSDRRPQRHGDRLVALASPRSDVMGVVALVDPEQRAGEFDRLTLEYAATVLAVELARLASTAEAELRVSRDLVDELLAGVDDEAAAIQRGQALGLDLERPRRAVVAHCRGQGPGADQFLHLVTRVARDVGGGPLIVGRGEAVVLLADHDLDCETLARDLTAAMGEGACRLAIGGVCQRPSEFARSYREAQLAMNLQANGAGPDVFAWESLGIYGILSTAEDVARLEQFVQSQLGALLDYDAQKGADLVETLFHYLESGLTAASEKLILHRNTLKYRLQRIQELSGHDLSDRGARFNLQLAARAWQVLKALDRVN